MIPETVTFGCIEYEETLDSSLEGTLDLMNNDYVELSKFSAT